MGGNAAARSPFPLTILDYQAIYGIPATNVLLKFDARPAGTAEKTNRTDMTQRLSRPNDPAKLSKAKRAAFLVLGLAFVGLGFIGALLPIMPTTIFLILAAACFARSNARLENWILTHRTFGPPVRAWRDHGAIPKPAKAMAVTGMIIGLGVFVYSVEPSVPIFAAVAAAVAACAIYVLTRPSA